MWIRDQVIIIIPQSALSSPLSLLSLLFLLPIFSLLLPLCLYLHLPTSFLSLSLYDFNSSLLLHHHSGGLWVPLAKTETSCSRHVRKLAVDFQVQLSSLTAWLASWEPTNQKSQTTLCSVAWLLPVVVSNKCVFLWDKSARLRTWEGIACWALWGCSDWPWALLLRNLQVNDEDRYMNNNPGAGSFLAKWHGFWLLTDEHTLFFESQRIWDKLFWFIRL